MAEPTQHVAVPVVAAWKSRINQIAVAVFGLAVPIGALTPFLPEPWKSRSLAAVSILGALAVYWYRTFQTASVTPSSVPTLAPTVTTLAAVAKNAGLSEEQQTELLNMASDAQAKR